MLDVRLQIRRGDLDLRVDFQAPTPGVTALFGVSGAGKTTVVHAVAGLIRPASGRVALDATTWFDGERSVFVPAERRRVGYVFQDARLFPHLDVLGNLLYGQRRVRQAGPALELDEVVQLLGLEALLARRVRGLSGGERSRVALGRALLARPQLLLLDEPLAALDAPRRAEVLPYLERLRDRAGVPMIYVSHQYDEVLRLADHLVLLADGRVVGTGSPAELSLNPALVALIGADAAGSVVEGRILGCDERSFLATIAVGDQTLTVPLAGLAGANHARILIPARDVMLATHASQGLSVRNQLYGRIVALHDEPPHGVLATVDVSGARLLARVTRAAAADLALEVGQPMVVLVKAESLRGRAYKAP
jgi:molybdate transport system ATP-binding protein